MGRTGSGKSSLLLALLRVIEPSQGKIYIDGVDISELDLNELRQHMAVIPQVMSSNFTIQCNNLKI